MNLIQMKEGLSSTADHAKSRFRVKNRKRKDFSTFGNKKHSEYEIISLKLHGAFKNLYQI